MDAQHYEDDDDDENQGYQEKGRNTHRELSSSYWFILQMTAMIKGQASQELHLGRHMDTRIHVGQPLLPFPGYQQKAGSKVDEPMYKPAPMWDVGIAEGGLTHIITTSAVNFFFFFWKRMRLNMI